MEGLHRARPADRLFETRRLYNVLVHAVEQKGERMEEDIAELAAHVRAQWRTEGYAESTIENMEGSLARFEKYAASQGTLVLSEDLVEGYAAKVRREHERRDVQVAYLRPVRRLCCECGLNPPAFENYHGPTDRKGCHVPERFVGAYDAYMAEVSKKGYSPYTLRAREKVARQFLAYADDKVESLDELRLEHCDGFLAEKGETCGACAVYRIRGDVKPFVAFLLESEEADDGLRKFLLDKPKQPAKTLQRFLSDEEAARLLDAADARGVYRLRSLVIVTMMLQYMIRECDLARLTLDDIDWVQNTITFRASKNGEAQVFVLTETIRYLLLDYVKNERPKTRHRNLILAAGYPHEPLVNPGSIGHVVRRLAETAGIDLEGTRFGSHALRRTGATMMMDENVEYHVISKVLMHRVRGDFASGTAMDYLRVDIERLRPVALEVKPYGNWQH